MNNFNQCQYWHWESVIPENILKVLIENVNWENAEQSYIGSNNEKGYDFVEATRKSDVCWEEKMSVIGCIARSYIWSANFESDWNFDLSGMEQIQMTRYGEGGHYSWHFDSKEIPETKFIRKLSCSILLNDDFEGGEFEFEDCADKILTKAGSIIVFPSFLKHRVKPVLSGTRYSAVIWSHGLPFR
jgi:PKHD-type hydroxylase